MYYYTLTASLTNAITSLYLYLYTFITQNLSAYINFILEFVIPQNYDDTLMLVGCLFGVFMSECTYDIIVSSNRS